MKKQVLNLMVASLFGITLSGNAQSLLNESFNNGFPSTWSQETQATDGGWLVKASAAAQSSAAFPIPDNGTGACIGTNDDGCGQTCNKLNDNLMTPSFDLSQLTSAVLKFNVFFLKETYQGNTESLRIRISTDGGSNWTQISDLTGATTWRTIILDLSPYIAESDVKIMFNYSDGGGWLYGAVIDEVEVYQPFSFDLSVTSVNLPNYAGQTNQTIAGSLFNFGAQTVTSYTLNYQVNNDAVVSQGISGVNIAPFTSATYSHPTAWLPSQVGANTVKVWATNINGNDDENTANDEKIVTVQVASQTVQKIPLVEVFSSATCPPCRPFNEAFTPILNNNNVNIQGLANVTAIKYQMNWPSPGTDPSYNPDGATRRTFYGISGIPSPWIDGGEMNGSQTEINNARAVPAIMNITATASYDATNKLNVSVDVTPYLDVASGTRLFIAAVEDSYDYNGQNGETEFHNVLRKMMPDGNGISLGAMTNGTAVNRAQNYTFVTGSAVTQGSYRLWKQMDNLTVVAFVQDPATSFVFQSVVVKPTFVGLNDIASFPASFFPNPANETAFVRFESPSNNDVIVTLTNTAGQTILCTNYGKLGAGEQLVQINTSDVASGLYLLNVKIGDSSVTKRVNIVH